MILCNGNDATSFAMKTGWSRISARIWYIDKAVDCVEVGAVSRIA